LIYFVGFLDDLTWLISTGFWTGFFEFISPFIILDLLFSRIEFATDMDELRDESNSFGSKTGADIVFF
jgi:hypothetical protein